MSGDPVALSESFLRGIRRGAETTDVEAAIAEFDASQLAATLDTDAARLAFWINVYNAATQRELAADPDQYESRRQFFATPLVTVAGTELSLDAIEHDILRRGYPAYTMGYVQKPGLLRDAFVRNHELADREPRIHFALNCGAASCPPIAAYTRTAIDDQLDLATRGYLDQTVRFDPDGGRAVLGRLTGTSRAVVPRVMLWFRGDFGGKRGIHAFLKRYDQIPADAAPALSYLDWDWSLDRGDFTDAPGSTAPSGGTAAGDGESEGQEPDVAPDA